MLDEQKFEVFMQGFEPEKAPQMVSLFIQSLSNHIGEATIAAYEHDAQKLRRCVHDIKSLCLMIGADKAGNLALKIQNLADDGQAEEAFRESEALMEMVHTTIAQLKARPI